MPDCLCFPKRAFITIQPGCLHHSASAKPRPVLSGVLHDTAMINSPTMPDSGNHSCIMWVVCSSTLFTTFQIVFGTIFWIFITQKGNLPVCEGFPLVFNNQKAQTKIIQSWINFGLVQNVRSVCFIKGFVGDMNNTAVL